MSRAYASEEPMLHLPALQEPLNEAGWNDPSATTPSLLHIVPPAEHHLKPDEDLHDATEDDTGIFDTVRQESIGLRQAIETHPLLKAEEEVALGLAVQAGRAAAAELQSVDGQMVSAERKAELQALVAAGKAARERFTLCNLRLVRKLAMNYIGRGVETEDLIQAGYGGLVGVEDEPVVGGLIHAVDKFDPTQGNKFSTYATYWIKMAFQRTLANQRSLIRVNNEDNVALNSMSTAHEDLVRRLHRLPSDRELAKELGLDVNRVLYLQQIRDRFWMQGAIVSTDQPESAGPDSQTIGETIGDDTYDPNAELNLGIAETIRLLGSLPARRSFVIQRLTGYGAGEASSESEVIADVGGGYTVGVLRRDVREACLQILRTSNYVQTGDERDVNWLVQFAVDSLRRPEKPRISPKFITYERLATDPSYSVLAERASMTMGPAARKVMWLHLVDGHDIDAVATILGVEKLTARKTMGSVVDSLVANAKVIANGGFDYAAWESASRVRCSTALGLLTAIGVPIPASSRFAQVQELARGSVERSQALTASEKAVLLQLYELNEMEAESAKLPSARSKRVKMALEKLRLEVQQSGKAVSTAEQEGCLIDIHDTSGWE